LSELPAPPVPAEADLRNFPFMPLDVQRLRDSDLAGTDDAEIFRLAVLSWCASWHQLPAGSLPDDDSSLARLLGFGRDGLKSWKKRRQAGALRGWIKCSDGRLYHPVVVEKVIDAWGQKTTASAKGKAGAAKRWGSGNATANSSGMPQLPLEHGTGKSAGTNQLMPKNSKGEGEGIEREGRGIRRDAHAHEPSVVGSEVTSDSRLLGLDEWRKVTGIDAEAMQDWIAHRAVKKPPSGLLGHERIAAAKVLAGMGSPEIQRTTVQLVIANGWNNLRQGDASAAAGKGKNATGWRPDPEEERQIQETLTASQRRA
jgi:hypothetical protein